MGSNLSGEYAFQSYGNIQRFKNIYGRSSIRHIVVKKSNNIILEDDIEIVISEARYGGEESLEINPIWEEFGYKNYKMMGLIGYYSSNFCKADFDGTELVVHSDNDIDILIS